MEKALFGSYKIQMDTFNIPEGIKIIITKRNIVLIINKNKKHDTNLHSNRTHRR